MVILSVFGRKQKWLYQKAVDLYLLTLTSCSLLMVSPVQLFVQCSVTSFLVAPNVQVVQPTEKTYEPWCPVVDRRAAPWACVRRMNQTKPNGAIGVDTSV